MNVTETNTIVLPLSELHENKGQIAGVPRNPRILKNERYKALLASLREDNLTGVMPLKVYNNNGEWVVIGGNMRLKALRELGASEVSCIIIPKDMPTAKLCKMVIIDNSTFGDWDMELLANEWDDEALRDWGVDLGNWEQDQETAKLSELKINSLYHTPEQHPQLTLDRCVDLTKYNAKMEAVRQLGLSDEQVAVMELFARRFIRIDFESVANYYAFNATDREKDAIERLRLVLVDGMADGLIEDEILRVRAELLQEEEVEDE